MVAGRVREIMTPPRWIGKMNYKESALILEEIKKAKRILLNCHRGPDPDSIGCALAMYQVLISMDKEVEIICPSDQLDEKLNFLKGCERIQSSVNFNKFDFLKFDLFITFDSSSWDMVSGDKDIPVPAIPIVVIDHHLTNKRYGRINLVDEKVTSVGELLYLVFEDWGVTLDKDISDALLVGVIGDTGAFRFPNSTARTFNIAKKLIENGAEKDKIIFQIYSSIDFKLIKFYGEVLSKAKIDKKNKFIWSAISYETYKKLGDAKAREQAVSLFAQATEGTDFGLLMTEEGKNLLKVSFRSRTGFDTSKIAVALGGGGHIYASGAKVEGLPFKKAVEKVLQTARKFAKEK